MDIKYPKVPTRYGYILRKYRKEEKKIDSDYKLILKFDEHIEDAQEKIMDPNENDKSTLPRSFQNWKAGNSRPTNIAQRKAILQTLGCQYIDTFFSDYDPYNDVNLKDDIYSQKYGSNLIEYFDELKNTIRQVLEVFRDSMKDSQENTGMNISQIADMIRDSYAKSTSKFGKVADFIKALCRMNFCLTVASFPLTFQKDQLQQVDGINTLSKIFAGTDWYKDHADKERKEYLSNISDLEIVSLLIEKYDQYFGNLMDAISQASSPGNNSCKHVVELTYISLYKNIANRVNTRYCTVKDDNKLLFSVVIDVLTDAMEQEAHYLQNNCSYDPLNRQFTTFGIIVNIDQSFPDDFFTEGIGLDINRAL